MTLAVAGPWCVAARRRVRLPVHLRLRRAGRPVRRGGSRPAVPEALGADPRGCRDRLRRRRRRACVGWSPGRGDAVTDGRNPPEAPLPWRRAAALGVAALTSTTNNGVWFELPIVVILVALVVSIGPRLPGASGWARHRAGSARRCPPVGQCLVARELRHRPRSRSWRAASDRRSTSSGSPSTTCGSGPSDATELEAAAAELVGPLRRRGAVPAPGHRRGPDRPHGHGNFEMFNSNTVQLAGEMEGWTARAGSRTR